MYEMAVWVRLLLYVTLTHPAAAAVSQSLSPIGVRLCETN